MKKFIQIMLVTIITAECFVFFGGYMLFDFSKRFFTATAAVAFLLSVVIYAFEEQNEKISKLENRMSLLEEIINKKD